MIDLYCNLMMIMSPAGEWKNKAFADNIIKETNAHWKALVTNKGVSDEVETKNTSVQNSHGLITLVYCNLSFKVEAQIYIKMKLWLKINSLNGH